MAPPFANLAQTKPKARLASMQRMVHPEAGTRMAGRSAKTLIPLDLVGTLAAAGLALFGGQALQARIRPLARHNVPAPVVGGLLVAAAVSLLHAAGHDGPAPRALLAVPLVGAFFIAFTNALVITAFLALWR